MKSKVSDLETKRLIDLASSLSSEDVRREIYKQLIEANLTEGQFHDAIEMHAPAMNLSSEQWLRLFRMYNTAVFRSRFDLTKLLSEDHFKQLMSETID